MTALAGTGSPISEPDRFFIGGSWVAPSSKAKIVVIDPSTEDVYFSVAEAQAADMSAAEIHSRACCVRRRPLDPAHPHCEAGYLRAIADGLRARASDLAQVWARESGILYSAARAGIMTVPDTFEYYASLASDFPFEERAEPSFGGGYGMIVREPVGVVGAIIPWNAPLPLLSHKAAPALLAGCTIVVKASPEAPGEAYILAEVAREVGLPGRSTQRRDGRPCRI